MSDAQQDPLDFFKALWGKLGFPLPGIVTPTVDVDELDKRITDLKAVEGWLKMNLGMLQMSIQGLEMQRATLSAWQAVARGAQGGASAEEAPTNPFAPAGLWPWKPMPPAAASPVAAEAAGASKPRSRRAGSRKAGA